MGRAKFYFFHFSKFATEHINKKEQNVTTMHTETVSVKIMNKKQTELTATVELFSDDITVGGTSLLSTLNARRLLLKLLRKKHNT